jgi:hypothetical protein
MYYELLSAIVPNRLKKQRLKKKKTLLPLINVSKVGKKA